MAVDMFLKIDGIKGESNDAKHKGEIDLLSWSWGMSHPDQHPGAVDDSVKVSIQGITITKHVDESSSNLMLHCCNGKHIKTADLYVRAASGTPLEYLKIHFEDVTVSSMKTGGAGSDARVSETVTLSFARFKTNYTPQKADGTGDAAIAMGWDVTKNQPIG